MSIMLFEELLEDLKKHRNDMKAKTIHFTTIKFNIEV